MRIPPFRLERFFAQYEFAVEHMLCASDCESRSISDMLSLDPASLDEFIGLRLGYTEARGGLKLREAITSLYTTVAPDDVLAFAGANEAIYAFMNVMIEPGDHAIVHAPHYQSLSEVARSVGCTITDWQTRAEDGWRLDVDALDALFRPETRVVVVNSPHNPTGYLMTPETQRALVEKCRARGVLLFSDEVYRELEHSPAARLPAACDLYENAVSLGVMSKAYGLAGLRIGWIATKNRAVIDRMATFKDYTSICNAGPSEWLATLALRHREKILARTRALAVENAAVLNDFLRRHSLIFDAVMPTAGCIAFPRLRRGSALAFCEKLLKETGVLLLPGELYGPEYDAFFRIGFGRADFSTGLKALDDWLT